MVIRYSGKLQEAFSLRKTCSATWGEETSVYKEKNGTISLNKKTITPMHSQGCFTRIFFAQASLFFLAQTLE